MPLFMNSRIQLSQARNSKPLRPPTTWFGALLLVCLLALLPASPANAAEYRAFWLDAFHNGFYNQSQVDTLLGVPGTTSGGQIRDVNCNAVVIQARKRADVCYPSGVGEPYMSGLSPADFNALAALIKAAHDTTGGKKRIEVHCWSVAFKTAKGVVYRQHTNTPTGSLTTFDNYWPTRVSNTNGAETADGAFDPGHPKCLEYLVNAHMDLVNFQTTAGPDGTDGHIDGIHYDYIRFEGSTEGYNPTSVARYNARYGLSGQPGVHERSVQAVAARSGHRLRAADVCPHPENQALGQAVRLLRHVEPLADHLHPGGVSGHAPLLRRLLRLG